MSDLCTSNAEFISSCRGKRLVFTVTTGRSGTELLQVLLKGIPDVSSVHEAEPNFVEVMREAQSSPDVARAFLVQKKLPAICGVTDKTYIETSHVFSKGFFLPLLDLGVTPELISITRDPRAVSKSLVRLDTVPERTAKGRRWLLSPTDPDVWKIEDWPTLSDYQLCVWYCMEMARRTIKYSDLLRQRGVNTYHIPFEKLVRSGARGYLRETLSLPRLPLWETMKDRLTQSPRVNAKPKSGAVPDPPNEEDLLEVIGRLSQIPEKERALDLYRLTPKSARRRASSSSGE